MLIVFTYTVLTIEIGWGVIIINENCVFDVTSTFLVVFVCLFVCMSVNSPMLAKLGFDSVKLNNNNVNDILLLKGAVGTAIIVKWDLWIELN